MFGVLVRLGSSIDGSRLAGAVTAELKPARVNPKDPNKVLRRS
jgi:hypothetical protein